MNELIMVLRTLLEKPECTQRELAKLLRISLGKLNQRVAAGIADGYLLREEGTKRGRLCVSAKGRELLGGYRVDAALILASGFGSRFVPLTYETPKGLLEVLGERMIERQIRQLHEAGITDIAIMVGYLKEKFDYLVDKYDLKLIYNPEYAVKNTLATVCHAADFLRGKNCYILSSDNWLRENLYHSYEPCSWYAASFMAGETREWAIDFGKNRVIREVRVGGENQWCMYGPVYLTREFTEAFLPLAAAYYRMPGTEQFYWEDVLIRNLRRLPEIHANMQEENVIYEFENLEELREFDERYLHHSGSEAMRLVSRGMGIPESDIINIRCLKAGMTNKSWLFSVSERSASAGYRGQSYICRIPGPGTEQLIKREEEAAVYEAVSALGITEDIVYFDRKSGYKLSRYYEGARNADFSKPEERYACMAMLKRLHNSGISLPHAFDIRERLRHYEALCLRNGHEIGFEDYPKIRMQADSVLAYLDGLSRERTICHIDSVQDNFLFTREGLRMIDWEYSGMADPLIDIAMSAIYSYMSFAEAEELLADYLAAPLSGAAETALPGEKTFPERGIAVQGAAFPELSDIVAAYMGLGGLLWALWGMYKISLGESFGEYTLRMYRYFKNAYRRLTEHGRLG